MSFTLKLSFEVDKPGSAINLINVVKLLEYFINCFISKTAADWRSKMSYKAPQMLAVHFHKLHLIP